MTYVALGALPRGQRRSRRLGTGPLPLPANPATAAFLARARAESVPGNRRGKRRRFDCDRAQQGELRGFMIPGDSGGVQFSGLGKFSLKRALHIPKARFKGLGKDLAIIGGAVAAVAAAPVLLPFAAKGAMIVGRGLLASGRGVARAATGLERGIVGLFHPTPRPSDSPYPDGPPAPAPPPPPMTLPPLPGPPVASAPTDSSGGGGGGVPMIGPAAPSPDASSADAPAPAGTGGGSLAMVAVAGLALLAFSNSKKRKRGR